MQSILSRARAMDITSEPFPHLVIHDALDSDYYAKLATEFPAAEIILNGREPLSNRNFRYTANDALDDDRISGHWREFIRYHASQEFFGEVQALFGSHIRMLHSLLETSVGKPLADWKSSVRFREPQLDIALECQFAYGTPVERRSRVIGPHVDREVALFAGLFYMRDDADDSDGGDLELYEFTGPPAFEEETRCVPDDRVKCFRSIRYAKNTLVFFLHSSRSLHGVTPRGLTVHPRLHINFVGELSTRVFDLTSLNSIKPRNPELPQGTIIT